MSDLGPEVAGLLERLVAINSVNPRLAPGAPGETEIAAFVRGWCVERDLEVEWIESTPGRPSLIARAPGRAPAPGGAGRSLMLNAHLDTVGVEGMAEPFTPRLERGRLYARGACDMKAGLAASLIALDRARRMDLRGDVILAAVADEEHGSLGTQDVLEHLRREGAFPDAAILTEPSGLELCIVHRGFAVFEIEFFGAASHTSQPEQGANTITTLGRALHGIERLNQELKCGPPHPRLGHASAQAVIVSGGSELFTTPARASLSFERRTLPGESRAAIEFEVERLLERALEGDPGVRASFSVALHRDPYEIAKDALIVQTLDRAASRILGRELQRVGAPYWMDSGLIASAGIPTVVFGVMGHGLHDPEEFVVLEEVAQLTRILCVALGEWCD